MNNSHSAPAPCNAQPYHENGDEEADHSSGGQAPQTLRPTDQTPHRQQNAAAHQNQRQPDNQKTQRFQTQPQWMSSRKEGGERERRHRPKQVIDSDVQQNTPRQNQRHTGHCGERNGQQKPGATRRLRPASNKQARTAQHTDNTQRPGRTAADRDRAQLTRGERSPTHTTDGICRSPVARHAAQVRHSRAVHRGMSGGEQERTPL
jgi:hypothetical protein